MDMVGRYREKLTLQGVGSSEAWSRLIEQANVPVGLRLKTQKDAYLPTDSTAFYARGVPVLSAFTGVHEDYHKPTDTPDKLNYDGLADVAQLVGLVGRAVAEREEAPDYVAQKRPGGEGDGPLRAYLGTIPDYSGDDDVGGVKLQGVAEGGPADEAGLQSGDVVVKLAGKKVENIYDYTYAIRGLKVGEEVEIEVRRDGEVRTLSITPASRQ
jgi:C-terminal processing protease CtpA/Prc